MIEVIIGGNQKMSIYTVEDLAETLSISTKTIKQYLREGRLRGRKIGKRWYIAGEAVQEYFRQAPSPDELDGEEE